jgi:hypothetical protein
MWKAGITCGGKQVLGLERVSVVDALMAVPWLAVNGLLIRASWSLASALDPRGSQADRMMHALVIGLSLIVAAAVVLGTIGWLSGLPLLSMVACTAILLEKAFPAQPSVNHEFQPRLRWAQVMWGIASAWLVSHLIVDGLFKFPTDWDCLMYHIPMVDEWLQARSLYAPDSSYWWSPGSSEVLGLWCVAPFSGDFLIALNNLPAMALWVVATLSTARSLGMSTAGSHLTAIAVVAVHTSFHETDDASNDLLLAAAFMSSIAYLLCDLRNPRPTVRLLGGLSLGLLAGVKYFSVGYVVLVLGVWGIAALLRSQQSSMWRALAELIAATLPAGAYWYLRNLVVSGTPFYPMAIGGASPAVGYPNVGTTSLWGNPNPARWSLVMPSLWEMTGPVHWAAVIVAPTVIFGLIAAALWISKDAMSTFERWRGPIFAALMAGCGLLIVLTPFAVEDQPGTLNHLRWAYTPVRYGLCFLSLAVIGLYLSLEFVTRQGIALWRGSCSERVALDLGDKTLCGKLARLEFGAAAAIVAWQVYLRFRRGALELEVIDSMLVAFVIGLVVLIWSFTRARLTEPRVWRCSIAATSVAIILAASVGFLSHRWHADFDRHYDHFFNTTIFSKLRSDFADADRICVLDPRHYAFFGSSRQRQICRPRYIASVDELIDYLDKRRVRYVATQNGYESKFYLYQGAPRWLRERPRQFVPRIQRDVYTLFMFEGASGGTKDVSLVP